jgi:RsiW-degrading membrane proteinase PrsW (M82 family)
VYHGLGFIMNRSSRPFRLPSLTVILLAFALVLGVGNSLLIFDVVTEYLFPFMFLLGAALPTLGVLAWAGRRLGWPITWRQGALALVSGSTLSVVVTLLFQAILSVLTYFLFYAFFFISPLGMPGPGLIERFLLSPYMIIFLITTALTAPVPEEFAKALGLPIFGRQRIRTERQALMIGLAFGAGFAILENMLYQGIYAQYSGWSWGGVTLLRGIGAVLHPLCTGLVALGWFRMREGGAGKLFAAYLAAVGLHTLWNGGFELFVFFSGLDYYGVLGPDVMVYGLGVTLALVVFLVVLSLALWYLLYRVVSSLGQDGQPAGAPTVVTPRGVALWALSCALVVVPIGAALGPTWPQIRAVVFAGL